MSLLLPLSLFSYIWLCFGREAEGGAQSFKYNGKELDTKYGLHQYDYSARHYDPATTRFTSVDPLAERYYSISPYVYCANNPINAIDPRGDSIWYTIDKNVITMNVQAKVINASSDNIHMGRAAANIQSAIASTFSGSFEMDGQTYELKTNVQISSVTSMEDVAGSDHLFVIADQLFANSASGATSANGGKVMSVAARDFRNDNFISNRLSDGDMRVAMHEFGHSLGIGHETAGNNPSNLMYGGGTGSKLNSGQRLSIYRSRGVLNTWTNSIKDNNGKKVPNPYMYTVDPNTKIGITENISRFGLIHRNK